ncbi:MAG TPA: YraN family protein [Nitrospiria bacterium]
MRAEPRGFGDLGEAAAARFLEKRGYRIVGRNVRLRRGEIDLIAYDREVLVFIEVKARRGMRFGGAFWAVDRRKRERLGRLAEEYLARERLEDPACRFDLVLIQGGPDGAMSMDLIQNAFDRPGD